MAANRRASPRYPSWLPGTVTVRSGDGVTTAFVRVVDLSLGGAAIEGDFDAAPGAPLDLTIESGELCLSANCLTISRDEDILFSVVRVRFAELSEGQRAEVTALVGTMAAEFRDGQVSLLRPGRYR